MAADILGDAQASPSAAGLTGLWARKKPEASDFQLSEFELDGSGSVASGRRLSRLGVATIAGASIAILGGAAMTVFGIIDASVFRVLLFAVGVVAIAGYWLSSTPHAKRVTAFHAAAARRDAFKHAAAQFETHILPWRQQQTDPQYWATLEAGNFDQAVADLILGFFPDGTASLTPAGSQSSDIVVSGGSTTVVAQCKRHGRASVDDVRQLAGAKLFYGAGIAICAASSFEDTPQMKEHEERCGLTLWDARDLANVAAHLIDGQTAAKAPRVMPISA
ncbi:MAG: restriction endonuclease [Alphaproteobacteria bacterium]|nr:restriction endonuclease [Alphaproteobacteria bacterium]